MRLDGWRAEPPDAEPQLQAKRPCWVSLPAFWGRGHAHT